MSQGAAWKVVEEIDNWPYLQEDPEKHKDFMRHYYRLYVKGFPKPVGFVHASVIVEMPWPDCWTYNTKDNSLVFAGGDTVKKRNEMIRETLLAASKKAKKSTEANQPLDLIKYVDYEEMPVYTDDGQHIMDVDLSATELLGLPYYSVVLIAWTHADDERYYWVSKIPWDHSEHQGKYDSFVVGTVGSEEKPLDRIKNLADEQTGLSIRFTDANLKECGTVSYHSSKLSGMFIYTNQRHVLHVYEIELEPTRLPTSEVQQDLQKLSMDQMSEFMMRSSEFEPRARMAFLDHFIRHGYLDEGAEPKLEEIKKRLHRKIEFPEMADAWRSLTSLKTCS